jgi:hypothetical protein
MFQKGYFSISTSKSHAIKMMGVQKKSSRRKVFKISLGKIFGSWITFILMGITPKNISCLKKCSSTRKGHA